ncbi:MAG: hypothetical protein QG656_1632, partial [Candidatus Hydrogenedentes bacterium]|nr:hypothetical protein [Candidatus Hydrogenedentota bacterium]
VRSYGYIEFVDLDGDGREDFLCIADFSQHHEVLLNRGGKMEKAWGYGWSESVTTGKVVTTWPEPPYADLDGDGGYEVLVSMYNSEGEGAWLVRAYDAVTGALEYRMPGLIAVASGDLDGDGRAEILANASTDPTKTVLGGARLLGVRDGALQEIWRDDASTAVKSKGSRPAKARGLSPQSKTEDAGFLVERGGETLALNANAEKQAVLNSWTPPVVQAGPDFSKVPAVVGPPFPTLLAANLTGDGRNEILVYQEPEARVLQFDGGQLTVVKTYTSTSLPVIADLNGDGTAELMLSTVRPDALPVVEAITPSQDDKPLWKTTFPEAGRPGLPQPRKAYLRAGRFTGKATPDIYVWAGTPIVRSAVLDGQTGALLWDRGETPGIERYWGPSINLASVWDYDGDGKEDLIFTNPDYYCVASGPTGEALLGPLFPPQIFNQPSQGLYTFPAILANGVDVPAVCLVAGHYVQGAMSLRAEPHWYDLPTPGENRCSVEGFMRLSDGTWRMGFGRQNGRLACIDTKDGAVRWELPLDASSSDVATCDVDGEGAPEFVFGTSHGTLYAVGDVGGSARVLWRRDCGSGLGGPIMADIDGDGASDAVVASADGYINLFGAIEKRSIDQ